MPHGFFFSKWQPERTGTRFLSRVACIFAFAALLLGGCTSDAPDPNAYPYRLHEVRSSNNLIFFEDLNGDGRDERIQASNNRERGALGLKTHTGKVIEQVNYAAVVKRPQFLDVEGDGTKEVLLPFLRGDSLFVSIVDARGRKQGHFFMTKGTPRREPEGQIRWVPDVVEFLRLDADGDGREDLVTVLRSRLAPKPRGVWVHSLPEARLIDHLPFGAYIQAESPIVAGDFDEDGQPDLLIATRASNNGGTFGELDDRHAWLGLLDLTTPLQFSWTKKVGGLWSAAQLRRGDFDGDGTQEVLAFKKTSNLQRGEPGQLFLIQPGGNLIYRRHTLSAPLKDAVVVDLNRDGRDEILTLCASGELTLRSGDLTLLRERQLENRPGGLRVVPDADGDGVAEIFVQTGFGSQLLNSELEAKAVIPNKRGKNWDLVRRGESLNPYLYLRSGNDVYDPGVVQTSVFRLEANPYYLLYRYGPWAAWLFAVGLLVGGGIWSVRHVRRRRRRDHLLRHLLGEERRGLLRLSTDGRVEALNAEGRLHLNSNGAATAHLDALRDEAPELADWLDNVRTARPAQPRQRTLRRVDGEEASPLTAAVEPLPEEEGWLVRLDDEEGPDESSYRAWGLMARRVAHDLKNPLTSILLTLQRMQMEYREQAPEMADTLDPYATRIEERIAALRQMARNVMKFVDQEDPALTRTDLSAFVDEYSTQLRQSLPSDIELRLDLEDDLPAAPMDHEQMHSVLDNLTSNAVEAMPEGGALTLATQADCDLWLPHHKEAQDCVLLEVRDTGRGMTKDVRRRLFEPGFSTREDGTGLGLAIVQKMIDDHGGHLEVESERDTGTVITLYLPVEE